MPVAAYVMRIHYFCQVPVAVGIKAFYQFFALVVLVGRCFEIAGLLVAVLLLCNRIGFVTAIGKQSNATCSFQAFCAAIGFIGIKTSVCSNSRSEERRVGK